MHGPLPQTLETDRLLLRKPRESDAAEIFSQYGQDPAVSRFMTWRPLHCLAEAENFIAQAVTDWQAGERFAYILEEHATPHNVIGMLDARLQGHTVDLGYVLAREKWGQGLMPEALATLSEQALASPSIYRLQATCDVDNRPSARILEKCGYTLEGRHERYVVHPNISQEPRPCFMYARCK